MAPPAARRVLMAALLGACIGVLPFARADLGRSAGLLSAFLAFVIVCDLLTSGLLFSRFLARGGSTQLGLACSYLLAGLLATVHALLLPGAWTHAGLLGGAQLAAWVWGAAHAWLPAGIALSLWGGPASLRRALGAPTVSRPRAAAAGAALAAVLAAALTAGPALVLAHLPDVMRGDGLTTAGRTAAPGVLAVDLAALVVVALRGRREELERRLIVAVGCLLAGTTLIIVAERRFTAGWYASSLLELAAALVVLLPLVGALDRLNRPGPADRRAATRDALTGTLTRAATLVAADHLHRTRPAGTPLAIALLDVDGLKAIGDRHGPLASDAVLLTVARRLGGALRDEDVLGRAGEDGFVLVLPGTDTDGATLAVDRAVEAVAAQPVGTWAHDVRTTASAGIAMVGDGEDAVAAALAAAERALHQAKAHGGAQVVSPARAQVVHLRRAAAGPQPE